MTWGSSEGGQQSANEQRGGADSGSKGPAGSCTFLTSRILLASTTDITPYITIPPPPPSRHLTLPSITRSRTTLFRLAHPVCSFVDPCHHSSELAQHLPCVGAILAKGSQSLAPGHTLFIQVQHRVLRGWSASFDDMSVGLRPMPPLGIASLARPRERTLHVDLREIRHFCAGASCIFFTSDELFTGHGVYTR